MSWEERPLGEVLREVDRSEPPSADKEYRQIGVQLWGRGAYERDTISGAQTQYGFLNRAESGDVIVSKIWARNGSVAVIDESLSGAFASPEFPLFESDRGRFDPRWFHWFTKTPACWKKCDLLARGTSGKNRIRPSMFLTIGIPLPPVDEQRRIVAKLDAAAERIARIEAAQSANAEDFDRTLHAHFASTLPHAKWMLMSEVAPLSWRQIEIDPEKNYTEFGVRSFFKGIFLRREVPGTAFSWQELYRIEAGDVVFSNIMAWEKAIAVARPEHEGWVGNHRMLTCEPNREVVTPSYLHHYFTTPEGFDKILRASPGTAARNKTLKAGDLMAIEVPVPPLAQQHAFDALCEKFALLRAAQQSRAADLSALMPTLLDRAFKGEL